MSLKLSRNIKFYATSCIPSNANLASKPSKPCKVCISEESYWILFYYQIQ